MIKFRKRKLHLKLKWGLLPGVICAIAAGIACGLFFPEWLVRVSLTFNGLFGLYYSAVNCGLGSPGHCGTGPQCGETFVYYRRACLWVYVGFGFF